VLPARIAMLLADGRKPLGKEPEMTIGCQTGGAGGKERESRLSEPTGAAICHDIEPTHAAMCGSSDQKTLARGNRESVGADFTDSGVTDDRRRSAGA